MKGFPLLFRALLTAFFLFALNTAKVSTASFAIMPSYTQEDITSPYWGPEATHFFGQYARKHNTPSVPEWGSLSGHSPP